MGVIHNKYPKPIIIIDKQDSALNVKKQILDFFSIGNKRLLTDLLWIQTLIESDLEHYQKKDLSNWLFLRFNSITYLDKYFYENYRYGGQYLSIVKDDLEGATFILEKGLKIYPQDYYLRYILGFSYYFELGDYKNALKHLELLRGHPSSPAFFESILNKMKLELDFNYDFTINYLEEVLSKTNEPKIISKIQNDIINLTIEKDLVCLEEKRKDCKLSDPKGKSYVKKGSKYVSQTPFMKYRLKKKGGAPLAFVDSI